MRDGARGLGSPSSVNPHIKTRWRQGGVSNGSTNPDNWIRISLDVVCLRVIRRMLVV